MQILGLSLPAFPLLPFLWHNIFLIVMLKQWRELLTLYIPAERPDDDVHQNWVHNVQYFLWMFAFLVAWFLLLLRSFTGYLRSCISLPGSIYTKQISKLCAYLKKMKFKALSEQWAPSRETSWVDPERRKRLETVTASAGSAVTRSPVVSWLRTLANAVILRWVFKRLKKKTPKNHVMISWPLVFQLDLPLRSL